MHVEPEKRTLKFYVGQTVYCLANGRGSIWNIWPDGTVFVRFPNNLESVFDQDGRRSNSDKFPTLFAKKPIFIDDERLAKLNEPHPDAFWLVFGNGPPTIRHPTEQAARDEAARLSRNSRGQRFYVLKTIAVVETGTETWRQLSPEIGDLTGGEIPF